MPGVASANTAAYIYRTNSSPPLKKSRRLTRPSPIPPSLSTNCAASASSSQGRPTPVYHCERLSRHLGTSQIYLKREDLNHTGAHKLNHCMGEGLLAKYMGKKRIIAETGAGQHGVALATAAAFFGLECEIHMGAGGHRQAGSPTSRA